MINHRRTVMEMLIGFIDKIMPGRKTYLLMVVGMGMVVCQMLGYHQFSPEAWGMMGIGGAATWKMGMDRK
jgi:nucleoside phosphorylase|tara:strand:- start:3369 stop:3578 length:210 start_codon:yes stop_codon:yes gene_type:complete